MILQTLFARLRLHRIYLRWWASLAHGGTRRGNIVIFFGLPTIAAVTVLTAQLRADSLESYLTGTTVIAGLLFHLVFQLSDWSQASSTRLDAHDTGEHLLDSAELALAQRRILLIQRTYADLCWAFVVSIVLVVALAVLGTGNRDSGPIGTAAVSLLGAHLVLLLLSAVTSAFSITAHDLDRSSDA